MSQYPKVTGHRRRTIYMPADRAKSVRLAAEYLGISSEVFIQQAITDHLRSTYAGMLSELA